METPSVAKVVKSLNTVLVTLISHMLDVLSNQTADRRNYILKTHLTGCIGIIKKTQAYWKCIPLLAFLYNIQFPAVSS